MEENQRSGNGMNSSNPFRWNRKSKHFTNDRFDGKRTPYNNEDELFEDLLKRYDELIFLSSTPEELYPYPLLRNKHLKYPNSKYWVCESLNVALVIDNNKIITKLNLYNN
jgi:hypothetical protein